MSAPQTSNRKFGFVLAVGFLCLTALVYWRKHELSPVLLSLAGGFAVMAVVFPPLLGPVQRIWLKVGAVLGYVNTRLLLSIIYFLIITPISLLMRLFRSRPIDPKPAPARQSYWHRRDGNETEMERQF